MQNFSINGNEVIFGTIGDASTSEGHFWEAINACGVLQVPVVMSIWDDGYGISVPSEYHTTRSDLSKVLSGFQRASTKEKGFEIFTVKAWDYLGLLKTYLKYWKSIPINHKRGLNIIDKNGLFIDQGIQTETDVHTNNPNQTEIDSEAIKNARLSKNIREVWILAIKTVILI